MPVITLKVWSLLFFYQRLEHDKENSDHCSHDIHLDICKKRQCTRFVFKCFSLTKRFQKYIRPCILLVRNTCLAHPRETRQPDVTRFSTCWRPVPYRQLLRGLGIRLQRKFSFTQPDLQTCLYSFISVNCLRKSSNRLYLNLELLISVYLPTTLYEKACCFQRLRNHLTSISFLS